MILRRFMQYVKEQNWFAVLIEIFIVVVGIFLALQADNWKQSVENADRDRLALVLFSEELATMIQRAEGDVNASKESALMYDALLEYFTDCSKISNYREAFIDVRKAGRRLRGINVMRAGLDAVAQPEVLYRINNTELSRSVSRIMELIDFWNIRNVIEAPELLSNYHIFASQFIIMGPLGWQSDGNELSATNESLMYQVDLQSLCQNHEAMRSIRELSISHKRRHSVFADWKSTLESALLASNKVLGN